MITNCEGHTGEGLPSPVPSHRIKDVGLCGSQNHRGREWLSSPVHSVLCAAESCVACVATRAAALGWVVAVDPSGVGEEKGDIEGIEGVRGWHHLQRGAR